MESVPALLLQQGGQLPSGIQIERSDRLNVLLNLPVYLISGASVLLLAIHALYVSRSSAEDKNTRSTTELGGGSSGILSTIKARYLSQRGGARVLVFNSTRLLGSLAVLSISIASLLHSHDSTGVRPSVSEILHDGYSTVKTADHEQKSRHSVNSVLLALCVSHVSPSASPFDVPEYVLTAQMCRVGVHVNSSSRINWPAAETQKECHTPSGHASRAFVHRPCIPQPLACRNGRKISAASVFGFAMGNLDLIGYLDDLSYLGPAFHSTCT